MFNSTAISVTTIETQTSDVNLTKNITETEGETLPNFIPTAKNIAIITTLAMIVFITMVGNLIVLIAFLIEPKLRKQAFNYFILNLAVTDFLVAITAMTFYTIDTVFGYWPFGPAMCGFWIYADYAMTFASVFTLTAISIDRFWCVTWPVHYQINSTHKKTGIMIAIVWICVVIIWTPPFIGDRLQHNEQHECIWEPSENKEFIIVVDVIGHYLPCALMVVSHARVFTVMRKRAKKMRKSYAVGELQEERPKAAITTISRNIDNGLTATNHAFEQGSSVSKYESQDSKRISVHTALRHFDNDDDSSSTFAGYRVNTREKGSDEHESHFTSRKSVNTLETNDSFISGSSDNFQNNILHMRSGDITPELVKREIQKRRNEDIRHNKMEKKNFVTLTYVLVSYLICWFPFYVTWDINAFHPQMVPELLYTMTFWMTYINSTLNPIIYAYTNKDFKKAFVKIINCCSYRRA